MGITISAHELAQEIRRGGKNTILASFWLPGEGAGHTKYNSEHIPTSLFCDPATSLSSVPSSRQGRNPLPDADTLQRAFEEWGLDVNHNVIVYDGGKGLFAARAWWILTWAGIENVRILDGGMAAWEAAGYDVVGGPGNLHGHCTRRPNPGQLPVADIDDVKSGKYLLLDTREANRYAGKKEHLDLKAGHIPGAVNVPTRELFNEDNTYRSPEELKKIFRDAGVDDPSKVIVYSGSGIHSAVAIAAMHQAGLEGAAVYIGGWSQWCANPKNPVERGTE
ncbi:sulfurtransferase [Corynebacterium aquilae]|uniref:Sulfultransferase n=1 Tax=Corynebacterium aquilae DSM 44791 TaxID=1431546 RepID=A0A1L7CI70_9CORY|nr:sulfurtransferase [Corynebacterium aquilae]APT85551.1 sulfultransferase [Corynebacterium aquilae DSM 44791]